MKRVFVVALLACLSAGCEPPAASKRHRTTRTGTGQASHEHLASAMDYLYRADEFEEEQASLQVVYHLNRWLGDQPSADDWEPDPMTERLARSVRTTGVYDDLALLRFQIEDVKPLQQAVWMRMVADWASKHSSDAAFEAWVGEQQAELGTLESEQLTVAQRLFDWTVRNIQLDALLPYPTEAVSGPRPGAGETWAPNQPPPLRGQPGPGYQAYPWQTLVHGHGDALQRARIFILLCRQRGIDAVMLAFPGKTTPPRPRPWLPAARIGTQLYLFDVKLGLPIPGPGQRGVATYEQVLQDPKLLSSLTVNSRLRYEIAPDDLENVQVLIDASATALSRRMQMVEQRLTGEQRTILTTAPSQIAAEAKKCRRISDVGLWRLPYETTWFQTTMQRLIEEDDNLARLYFLQFGVFDVRSTLVRGRYLHLKGVFDNRGEEKGAKSLYMETRIPQAQLEALTTNEEVQRQLGLVRGDNERDLVWANRLNSSEVLISQAKQHSTYWLGLAQFDTAKYDSAVEWLERRTLEGLPESPWVTGARYNTARAYEAQGNLDLAKRWYRADDDDAPQRHGNLLRARMLEAR